jgi:ATP-dependent Clp protease ATP-binding subunit ClpC
MLERYDAAALLMLRTAKLKAQTLGHPCIGTADLLLGLIDNPNSEGTRALRALDISIESLRRELEDAADREESGPDAYLHFSPRGKRVLEAASRESLRRGEDHIGTEHVLIGLVGEEAGAAGRVLARLSVDPTRIEGALSRPETR